MNVDAPVLEVHGLTKLFGGLAAVVQVEFSIRQGEIFGLIGPNGAGKTTLFNMLTGITRPTKGTVRFLGRNVTGRSPERIALMGMARTFQNIRLFGQMSVLDNVRVPLHAAAGVSLWQALSGLGGSARKEAYALKRAWKLLKLCGLADRAHDTAASLPYGARRMLEIARALALSPKLLLLDEPAAGMNPTEKTDLAAFIADIRDRFDLTVLLIEHNVPLVMGLCQRVGVLNFGQLLALGSAEEVRNDPDVVEAYLGAEHA
ncbi:ABC transporter ATP-binding protein [Fundidesulfovibrio butyratiphilus]